MVRVSRLAVATALCALHAAYGLHIDVSPDGHVAIDTGSIPELSTQSSPSVSSERTSQLSNHVSAADEEKYEVSLGSGIYTGQVTKDDYVLWRNIPYAYDVGTNETRWARPFQPEYDPDKRHEISDKSIMCPQVIPGWTSFAKDFLEEFGDLNKTLSDKWKKEITPADYKGMTDLGGVENCLFLDVHVPKAVWKNRNARNFKPRVVVWIHGGGFVYGSKDINPKGLFAATNSTGNGGEEPIVLVSINYRLGMFGWLGGPEYNNLFGPSNLGLLDQRQAIEWVRDNIAFFGGNSGLIAVMGESAGAASILHHLTSNVGTPGFDKAILMSPGFFPQPDSINANDTYNKVLSLAGVKDMDELAVLDSKKLLDINRQMIFNSTYGQFTFGPLIDGIYVNDLPAKILHRGDHYGRVAVLTGYTARDGLLFTPPWIRDATSLKKFVRELYPKVTDSVLAKITDLYPINALIQKAKILQVADMLNDVAIKCNVYQHTQAILAHANSAYDIAYRYRFNAGAAVHGYDLDYIFYPEEPFPIGQPANETLAKKMQTTFVDFIRYYNPNPEDSEEWVTYANDTRKVGQYGRVADFFVKADFEFRITDDNMEASNREKCDFWMPAPQGAPETRSVEFMVQNEL